MYKKRFSYSTTYGAKPNMNSGNSAARAEKPMLEPDTLEFFEPPNTCTSRAYQRATVSVPVSVKPFSKAGKSRTYCSSKPVLREVRCERICDYERYYDDEDCYKGYDKECCCGNSKSDDEICCFVFTQEICIEVPVRFGAVVHADQPWVQCHEVSTVPCGSRQPDENIDYDEEEC